MIAAVAIALTISILFARAFTAPPALILADEPTGSLDQATGQKIVPLVRHAVNTPQSTALVVTPGERVAARADRRLEIEDGVLTEIA